MFHWRDLTFLEYAYPLYWNGHYSFRPIRCPFFQSGDNLVARTCTIGSLHRFMSLIISLLKQLLILPEEATTSHAKKVMCENGTRVKSDFTLKSTGQLLFKTSPQNKTCSKAFIVTKIKFKITEAIVYKADIPQSVILNTWIYTLVSTFRIVAYCVKLLVLKSVIHCK